MHWIQHKLTNILRIFCTWSRNSYDTTNKSAKTQAVIHARCHVNNNFSKNIEITTNPTVCNMAWKIKISWKKKIYTRHWWCPLHLAAGCRSHRARSLRTVQMYTIMIGPKKRRAAGQKTREQRALLTIGTRFIHAQNKSSMAALQPGTYKPLPIVSAQT